MSEQEQTYSSDAPVDHPDNDVFRRWPFAQRVAQVIATRKDKSSIVIGIDGVWGDGKTSVLNFIQHELNRHSDVVCMKFNPWRFGDEEQLLKGFFFDLANSVDQSLSTSVEKIGDLIKRFGKPIASLAGQGEVAEGLGDMLTSAGIEDLRQRIEKILDDQSRRVVILVDDIDRLEKSEIHAIFRLVKLTADFKNTAYVLAFDHEMVASALQDRFGSGQQGAGKAFLEKIIQVPLQLPEVNRDSLRTYCFSGVEEALVQAGAKLDDRESRLFLRNFTLGLEIRLKTPRQAKLYGNILTFSMPILKGEINYIDLMLIEGIRIFYPSLYNTIRCNQALFLKEVRGRDYSTTSERHTEKLKSLISESLEGLNVDEVKAAQELLKYLFPRLQAVYGNTHFGTDWDNSWALSKRICSSSYIARYFSYTIPVDDVSDQSITEFIEKSSEMNVEYTKNELISIMNSRNTEAVISKISQKTVSMSDRRSRVIAVALASSAKLIPNLENGFSFFTPFSHGAMLVSDLVSKVPTDERSSLAKEIMHVAEPITFGYECLRWFKTHTEEKPDPEGFNLREMDEIGRTFAERISVFEGGLTSLTNEFESKLAALLYTWIKYGEAREVNERITSWLDENPKNVNQLLLCYLPTAWGLESGLSYKADFELDQYKGISKVVDPEVIMKVLNRVYDNLSDVDEYPRSTETSLQLRAAKQFSWLHKNAHKFNEDTEQEDIEEM
ncbi:P-loop NTPase fold protein [Paenibacillus pabuli]|uniref:KAP family P-loop NTPase fold protein n=1 Tax=Paenibacillus pabuli TaxID=1472 RepID=UPI003457A632